MLKNEDECRERIWPFNGSKTTDSQRCRGLEGRRVRGECQETTLRDGGGGVTEDDRREQEG